MGGIVGRVIANAVDSVAESMSPDPLAADGKPIDPTWENEAKGELHLDLHRAELALPQLNQFLPRLGVCFEHSLEAGQLEILRHRVGRLTAKKGFHGYYSVGQGGVVTNLEVMIEHQLRGSYVIALRGIGPAMDIIRDELAHFQDHTPDSAHTTTVDHVEAIAAAPAVAAVAQTQAPATNVLLSQPAKTSPVKKAQTGIPADGIMRLSPDRQYWQTLLPLSRGDVLGHPIYAMVENKRQGERIHPQQMDHELVKKIFDHLPHVIDQVVLFINERIVDAETLASLSEPMICIYANRVDPESWFFYLTQAHPEPTKFGMEFHGVMLVS